jgi:hypothetical protein
MQRRRAIDLRGLGIGLGGELGGDGGPIPGFGGAGEVGAKRRREAEK